MNHDPLGNNPYERMTFTFSGIAKARLVLVTVSGEEKREALARVVAGEDVPAGAYARTALCAHAATTDDASAWLDRVDANTVSEEPDVRHVLTKLILGEADAGIVYASDAAAAELAGTPLTVIELPDDVSVPATYPIAPVDGGNTDLALAFIGFALSDEGQAILAEYGFA